MKIKIVQPIKKHTDVCTAVAWSNSNELYSCSDDKAIWKWSMNCEPISKLCDVDTYITDIHWFPSHSKRQSETTDLSNDVFVAACADCSFRLISKSGRVEKIVKDSHKGAVVTMKWNYEGTTLASGGEDGVLKTWSRGGQVRSTLASTGKCIYSLAWGPQGDTILFTCGKDLIIKPIHASSNIIQWKAHDGVVLKVDWSPLTNLIVSAGEDGRYKVWDSYGRNIFSSSPYDYSITSVAWCPSGEMFAVGSFNMIKVCDKIGWTISGQTTDTGSILNIAWTSDGTQFAAAGGNGAVCFGQLVERQAQWKNYVAILDGTNKIKLQDILKEDQVPEELDFRDKVINMSIGYGYLIVATATQCFIYDVTNLSSSHVFDVKDTVHLIMQCKKVFLMMDNFSGIQVYTYNGLLKCNPKFSGLRTEFLNPQSVSLSNDTLAIIDLGKRKSGETQGAIRLFDISTGKQYSHTIKHNMEIVEVALNQTGSNLDRKLVFIDRNRDLYICTLRGHEKYKLATMVDSIKWNDSTEMLVAIADSKFIVWYYPSIVYIDRDLLPATKHIREDSDFGKRSHIINFIGNRCEVRRWNGVVVTCQVSPYPIMLSEMEEKKNWGGAIRLCRFVKDNSLWACLAAMAIKNGQLNVAEVALAAIEEVDKLQYISYIKSIPTIEGRNAELALYQRRPEEAESILLQAGLIYRAIKMHIRLFNWSRALEIAKRYKVHIDTVLGYRQKFLKLFNQKETNLEFAELSQQVQIDWNVIKQNIKNEKEKEKQLPGTKPYPADLL